LETQVLNNKISTTIFNNFLSLKSEVDTLEIRLEKMGYIELETKQFERISDTVFLAEYHLNTFYNKIIIHNTDMLLDLGITPRELESISLEKKISRITIPFEAVESVLSFMNSKLSEIGDPFVKVKLDNIKPSYKFSNTLEANLEIELNSLRIVTGIKIMGYEDFPRAFLRYTAGIREGMLFQREKIVERSFLLDNLGFAQNIKSPEVLFTPEETELYLYLEKKSNNLFDGIIGFTTNEDTNKLELNGYVNLQLSNNLNFGEMLQLQYKNDGSLQEQFQVDVEMPFLFQTPIGLELGLDFFKRDSTFLTVEKNALANYYFNTRTKVFAGYKDYESKNLLDSQEAGNLIEDFNSAYFVFGGNYSIPQRSELFPVKTRFLISNEIGIRKITDIKTNQYRFKFRASNVFNLNANNSIYLNNDTRYLSSENYLINELFRFGGINSVRGFDENSIDASIFSVLNLEYRYLLMRNTYIHSITDLAYFENRVTQIESQIYSFGIGLGLKTNAGLFKLVIANGALEKQDFKFSNTKIHISLNSRF
jgi:hypothetical protein